MTYVTYLFGFPVGSFRIRTVVSWLLFHGLDVAAVLVLAGIALALWRRMRDRGALALQDFAHGLPPADPAVRDLGHRARAHRVRRSGCAARSTASSRSSTRSR